jgi:thiaminase/transcriptional activator TenA
MAFSDTLLAEAEPVWRAQYDHPFVTELADGTLDPDAFRHWVEQDYRYLLDYADVFSLAAADADNEATSARLAATAHRIREDELDLHREFAADYGLAPADLEAVEKAPTCQAYTDHLVRAAREGGLPTTAAAVYPCGQGYLDVADHMAERADGDHRYTPFIEKYTSDAFRETVAWLQDLVDRLADANPGARDRMRAAFHRSARLEHDFWEMAYTRETWSVSPAQNHAEQPPAE